MKLPKVYEPAAYEADIYALWEKSQAFQPRKAGKSYAVVVPPPNANGNLHLGHAITLGLQDIAVRYHRMIGDSALLLPGADHAGFETQAVYEKHLAKEGKSRFDFGREELYRNVWDFVAQNRANFEGQFRRLGAGVDWSRYTFTLDEKIVKRAYATFKKMWDEKLIYRGERLVNYCTFHGTAFADIEVDYKEEKSHLWYIRYPSVDGAGELVIATTRPETMLGDTAVAVHPDDERYKSYIGTTVRLPLVGREIPVIGDDFVETEFGTGAVKITPAHDPNDFEAGQRHNLPMITVIDHEGNITTEASDTYRGLKNTEARKQIVKDLEEQGYLVKVEELVHNVGHCYKCGTIIEPLLREQWFVDMKPLTAPAIKALGDNKIAFYPEVKKVQLITYLENLKDWNISRQIAWGIPIPAFQNVDDTDDWIYDERVDQEIIEVDGKTYRRDPDVFDTWFSSSSWPYATLDYPDGPDFNQHYPLSLMETGFDILYPWVSRMLMLGLYVTGEVPFKAVYLHGLILDEHGQKMSKSKGNVVNPMDIVDEYGSDAMRMGIITGQTAGNNQPFGISKVVAARNFCNKLWNIARYIEDKVGKYDSLGAVEAKTDADHWMLSKLQQTTDLIAADLDGYRFAEAYDKLYHFVWDDFADWYIEASKAEENLSLLAYALEVVLKIAHPFAPFVTETIWQVLSWKEDLLAASEWPAVESGDSRRSKNFEMVKQVITEVRSILKNLGLRESALDYREAPALQANAEVLKRMGRLSRMDVVADSNGLRLTQSQIDAWLAIESDVAKKYTDKLEENRKQEAETIARLAARLSNKSYVDNAPEKVVAQTKQQLADAKTRMKAIQEEIRRYTTQ
ncbi:MAG TPA: valine--tRNA ligase [Candidatus Saccharimonadales bacterium]|nr:valine--tRNA ligase [Candidatus Saccharimonadales bacterium]